MGILQPIRVLVNHRVQQKVGGACKGGDIRVFGHGGREWLVNTAPITCSC